MELDERLHAIRERIDAACELAGRDPAEVMLLPVSKSHSAGAVRELTYHGCRVFGESKIQEAKLKISACPGNLEWQLIGHLQSNKCRDAVRLFRMIQSVDRMSIAEEINRHAHNAAKDMPVLLEVNIAGEGSKYGFNPAELLDVLEPINDLPRLEIHGTEGTAIFEGTELALFHGSPVHLPEFFTVFAATFAAKHAKLVQMDLKSAFHLLPV